MCELYSSKYIIHTSNSVPYIFLKFGFFKVCIIHFKVRIIQFEVHNPHVEVLIIRFEVYNLHFEAWIIPFEVYNLYSEMPDDFNLYNSYF